MTPTSATKTTQDDGDGSELLALIARRASHEVRNALNGIAVNVEVVRSRLSRPDTAVKDLLTFTERASEESEKAAVLAAGLAELTLLFAQAATANGKSTMSASDGERTLILPVASADRREPSADLMSLAARIGIEVRLHDAAVIFTVCD